jgi:hypothetical protein
MDKAEFTGPNRNLASRCTVAHNILSIEDPIFHQVVERMREEKENALLTYGTKLLTEDPAYRGVSARIPSPPPVHHSGTTTGPDRTEAMLNGIAKAFSDSTNKYQTSADREREKDADEVARQYSLLFASTIDIVQDDGTTVSSILPATINPIFKQVLYATKNSKTTRLMKEAADAVTAELNQSNDKFASAATFNSSYIDQPLVAALESKRILAFTTLRLPSPTVHSTENARKVNFC